MERPNKHICCNYDDIDPISLEKVKSLQHFFYLKGSNQRLEACDAVAWLQLFAKTPEKWPCHPCTREPLEATDIWDCFTVASKVLGTDHESVKLMRQTRIYVQKKGTNIELRVASPLFTIVIKSMSTIEENSEHKITELKYSLCSSADKKKELVTEKVLRITVPSGFKVWVSR